MINSVFDMTPIRPAFVQMLSVRTWADLQMLMSFLVIVLTFAEAIDDQTFKNKGILGCLIASTFVGQATFAIAMLFDGVYIHAHYLTENPRAMSAIALFILSIRQARYILTTITTRKIVEAAPALSLPNEIPQVSPRRKGPPFWVLMLVDTHGLFDDLRRWIRGRVGIHGARPH